MKLNGTMGLIVAAVIVVGSASYVQFVMVKREREAMEEAKRRHAEREADVKSEPEVDEAEPPPVIDTPAPAPEGKEERPRNPKEAKRLIRDGLSSAATRKYDEAAGLFAQASLLDPYDPVPLFYLSYIAMAGNNWSRALSYLWMAMQADADWLTKIPDPRTLFGEKYPEYVRALEAAVGRNPGDAATKTLLALHYYFLKTGTHAKAMAHEALSADPENREAKELVRQLEKAGH